MKSIAYSILLSLVLTSCVSEIFVLNEGTEDAVYGKILTQIDSVETTRTQSLLVHSGGIAALRDYEETQSQWLFLSTLQQGNETVFRVRAVPIEFELTPSVDIHFSTSGCRIEEEGRLLVANDTVRARLGVAEKIEIRHEGPLLTVTVGCTRVYQGPVQRPGTEWLVVESPSGSAVEISRIHIEETR